MSPKSEATQTYYLLPNLQALDPSACELDLNSHTWIQPIIIEDEDLMFGGKTLSAWYEEDRSRLSSGASDDGNQSHSEEERRGRERVRRHYDGAKTSRKTHRKREEQEACLILAKDLDHGLLSSIVDLSSSLRTNLVRTRACIDINIIAVAEDYGISFECSPRGTHPLWSTSPTYTKTLDTSRHYPPPTDPSRPLNIDHPIPMQPSLLLARYYIALHTHPARSRAQLF